MSSYIIDRYENILNILIIVGEASNRSEASMMLESSSPIFIDNERIYHSDYEISFVMKHKVNKLYDRYKNNRASKRYSMLELGGSYDPKNKNGRTMYKLIRNGSKEGVIEFFK